MRFQLTLIGLAAAALCPAQQTFSWRYYRPTNTGIQGDICEAISVGPDSNPWIGGYDASFEEGGIARFHYGQGRWENISNVDYAVIGHPENTGTARISDIDRDANGRLWMATGRGALFYDPAVGPSSLRRFGDDNSPIPGGWNRSVEVAPDGTVWFAAYSTVWGTGGISRYNPTTNQWLVFGGFGSEKLAIQPKPGGGYYAWTMSGNQAARFDSATSAWTTLNLENGAPSQIPGNNSTDAAGNTWMYRWTNATLFESQFDYRRPDGTWANIPRAPFDHLTNGVNALRTIGIGQILVVDGGGEVWKYNGATWQSLGIWNATIYSYDVDVDASGNVWVCGIGGAARRDAITGSWQRYRLTNTSQYDFFNNDLTLDANGTLYACANAGPGYGGMVKFDGTRWTGFNQAHYNLGFDWPFPTDNSERVYVRPSNGEVLANPMFNGLHKFDGSTWTDLNVGSSSAGDIVEDSLGRLWTSNFGGLLLRTGSTWTTVSDVGGSKIRRDPVAPGVVWSMSFDTIVRTDGVTETFRRQISDFPELSTMSDQFKGFVIGADGSLWLAANTINLPDNSALFKITPTTGAYTAYLNRNGWPFPGQYVAPVAATPDGKIWMQYDSDFLVAQRGLCWFNGSTVGLFPAPPQGEPQWGGLPHAGITDVETRMTPSGYEVWLSCASRGIAVLTVTNQVPTPSVSSLSPTNVVVNQGNFVLTVNGSNFVNGSSVIRWNGIAQPTTFVNAGRLTASVANATNQTIGLVPISVANGTVISNTINLPARGTVVPTAFSVLTGTTVAGGLAELLASDDLRLRVRPDFSGARVNPNVVIESTLPSPVATPSQLTFSAEVRATAGPNVLKLQAFDFVSNAWVDLVTTNTSATDTTISGTVTATSSRFVSGGQMKTRVWVKANTTNGSRSWEAQVDRVVTEIAP